MKPVGDNDEGLERIGHAKRPHVLGGRKDGETMSLKPPELVVIDEIIKLFGDGRSPLLVGSCSFELLESMPRHVLEFDAISLRLLSERRRAQDRSKRMPRPERLPGPRYRRGSGCLRKALHEPPRLNSTMYPSDLKFPQFPSAEGHQMSIHTTRVSALPVALRRENDAGL